MPYKPRPVIGIKMNGWNRSGFRFIDAPTWTWDRVDAAYSYEVRLAGVGDTAATTHRVDRPVFDMNPIWSDLPAGDVDMLVLGFDAGGAEICHSAYKNFLKVSDFDGRTQTPLDWSTSAARNLRYLLAPARDRVEEYEEGLPRSVWSSMEDSVTGQRWSNTGCVGQYFPAFINGLLLFAEQYPQHPLADTARDQARAYGNFLLEHRLPDRGPCRGLSYSLLMNGEFAEVGWGTTPFYVSRVGIGMVRLYHAFGESRYLDYARHVAEVLMELQRQDGSWPFRIDPKDGKDVPGSEYTANAVEPATLYALLQEVEPSKAYGAAESNAIDWMIANPVATNRWEQVYCDAEASPPWDNLDNWTAFQMVQYLVHRRDRIPEFLTIAEKVNRFVEDQFVVWCAEDYPPRKGAGAGGMGISGTNINLHMPTPMVLEQYYCPYPMESHTGNWALALIALHEATGNDRYLSKAVCAVNAVVRGQQDTGAYATWGFDTRFGRPLDTFNWPPDNVCGLAGVIGLDCYLHSLESGDPWRVELRGV